MEEFEIYWRRKIAYFSGKTIGEQASKTVENTFDVNPISYSKNIISKLKNIASVEDVKHVFQCSACHLPHEKLEKARKMYLNTNSIEKARKVLEASFREDIKAYKKLSDEQVETIIRKGWGLAGLYRNGQIIATKIPAMFHEYFEETDEKMKKYYYCHCPRVRKNLLNGSDLDSIYCNCGGGFYKDVWEYITLKPVKIHVDKNLFDGDDVCRFIISFT